MPPATSAAARAARCGQSSNRPSGTTAISGEIGSRPRYAAEQQLANRRQPWIGDAEEAGLQFLEAFFARVAEMKRRAEGERVVDQQRNRGDGDANGDRTMTGIIASRGESLATASASSPRALREREQTPMKIAGIAAWNSVTTAQPPARPMIHPSVRCRASDRRRGRIGRDERDHQAAGRLPVSHEQRRIGPGRRGDAVRRRGEQRGAVARAPSQRQPEHAERRDRR